MVASTTDASSTTPAAPCDPRNTDYHFLPKSTDSFYLNQFYHFLHDWERWQMNNHQAYGQLTSLMESAIQMRYREISEPKQLWDTIKSDFEKVIMLDG
jgi:hypothetical protein